MPVLVTQDIPFNLATVMAVTTQMDIRHDPPGGLLLHLITETSEGVRVVDLWQSSEQYQGFRDIRLAAAMGKVMADHGVVAPSKLPQPTITPAHDVIHGPQLIPSEMAG
jgi:hypothetical protein